MNCIIIGSGNGSSPVQPQAITWTNADLLSIGLPGTYFSEIGILSFSFNATENIICQNGGHFVWGRWVNNIIQPVLQECINHCLALVKRTITTLTNHNNCYVFVICKFMHVHDIQTISPVPIKQIHLQTRLQCIDLYDMCTNNPYHNIMYWASWYI